MEQFPRWWWWWCCWYGCLWRWWEPSFERHCWKWRRRRWIFCEDNSGTFQGRTEGRSSAEKWIGRQEPSCSPTTAADLSEKTIFRLVSRPLSLFLARAHTHTHTYPFTFPFLSFLLVLPSAVSLATKPISGFISLRSKIDFLLMSKKKILSVPSDRILFIHIFMRIQKGRC